MFSELLGGVFLEKERDMIECAGKRKKFKGEA